MNIKKGTIAKVAVLNSEVKQWGFNLKDLEGQIMVIEDMNETEVVLLNQDYNVKVKLADISLGSARLNSDVRTKLKELYNTKIEMEKVKKQIKELENKTWELRKGFENQESELRDLISTVNNNNVTRITTTNYYTVGNHDKHVELGIGFEQCIAKWINENKFSFIMQEYDNSLHIYDSKQAVKQCALNISAYATVVEAIKTLTKSMKGLKLKGIEDKVSIGDKNTLYAGKIFVFEIKKGLLLSELKEVFAKIDKEIAKISRHFPDKF
ncbi:hypothetical protein CVD28_02010 [Bacillus sp. M6-12]|uniref:hypothetical protein n=1 Tax=Bacillus sp. M6-12 TaxID=2054166 RepID=UPI000C77D146|nr:hypothetical protein [Bacillus sp. M6-12]PLS19207.1 hypothetical protein CVD28_02010 [Bacillus sp. M6-12]